MLDSHLKMDRIDYIISIEHLLSGKKYGVIYWNDPWLVMKKGKVNKSSKTIRKIEQKLNQLRKEWKIKNTD